MGPESDGFRLRHRFNPADGGLSEIDISEIDLGARIARILCRSLVAGRMTLLRAETRLVEDLRADSLDLVMIQMALEEEFSIAISDDEGAALETVGDIAALVRAKRDARVRIATHGAEGLQP